VGEKENALPVFWCPRKKRGRREKRLKHLEHAGARGRAPQSTGHYIRSLKLDEAKRGENDPPVQIG